MRKLFDKRTGEVGNVGLYELVNSLMFPAGMFL